MVLIEVFLKGPQVKIVQSAAELDPDPHPDVHVFSRGELKGFFAINVLLSIFDSHLEQLALNGVEDTVGDSLKVYNEIDKASLFSELVGPGLGQDLIVGKALVEDVSGSSPRDIRVCGVA